MPICPPRRYHTEYDLIRARSYEQLTESVNNVLEQDHLWKLHKRTFVAEGYYHQALKRRVYK